VSLPQEVWVVAYCIDISISVKKTTKKVRDTYIYAWALYGIAYMYIAPLLLLTFLRLNFEYLKVSLS
jgi:polyferredoxin